MLYLPIHAVSFVLLLCKTSKKLASVSCVHRSNGYSAFALQGVPNSIPSVSQLRLAIFLKVGRQNLHKFQVLKIHILRRYTYNKIG